MRKDPNIIITGTPGVGKTTHCEMLAERTGLRHVSINQIVKDEKCHYGRDEEYESWIVDEDKLLDVLESQDVVAGGCILDWHHCDLFPERWIDLVVVLRVGTTTLYDRLTARKYAEQKLQDNLDSEIMEIVAQEADEAYDDDIIVQLKSDTTDEMEENIRRIEEWIRNWKENNGAY